MSASNIFGTKERETRYVSDYIFDKTHFKDDHRFSILVRYTFKDKNVIRKEVR